MYRLEGVRGLGLALAGLLAASGAVAAGHADAAESSADPAALAASTEIAVEVGVRVTAIPGLMEGDASMDGATNIIDAMFVAQHSVGLRALDAFEAACADTNDDGRVDIVDAMHIAQYTVDPTRSQEILFKPLWEEPADAEMHDPLTYEP